MNKIIWKNNEISTRNLNLKLNKTFLVELPYYLLEGNKKRSENKPLTNNLWPWNLTKNIRMIKLRKRTQSWTWFSLSSNSFRGVTKVHSTDTWTYLKPYLDTFRVQHDILLSEGRSYEYQQLVETNCSFSRGFCCHANINTIWLWAVSLWFLYGTP